MQLNPRVHIQEVGNETAIVQFETGLFYGLNEGAQHILSLLQKGKTRDEIVTDLARTFEIAEMQAAADTDQFLGDLVRENILKP